MINENEFKEWLEHPVTKAVKVHLANRRKRMMEDWAECTPQQFANQEFTLDNAANIGLCRGYKNVIDLEFDEIIGDLDE